MILEAILKCHPESSLNSVRGVEARLELAHSGTLVIGYSLTGAIDNLRIPPSGPVRRGDNLWQHTCFELFVSAAKPGYYEFNFSPSGEWAIYRFASYRQRAELDRGAHPEISIRSRRAAENLELETIIDLTEISETCQGASLRVGISAVIEDSCGALSYWALQHPGTRPDFHHDESFALQLPAFDFSASAGAAK
jgi:hypothetical protein